MHPSAAKVAEAAAELGLSIQVVEFAETTRTAADAAAAIGCQTGQIVKSLLFMVGGQPIMALVAGDNRLDTRKLAAQLAVGRKQVRRADADQVKAATGFSIGGVPPFGHVHRLPVYIDRDLGTYDLVWAAAGTPHAVFSVPPAKLVAASGGLVIDLRVD
ncbi:MAG: YbaK/EbsC family protein [Candidatus Promineifilaceae bacterium]|nr:YbaK/EbsC family protein [Candidatus Promineifilaceae bacterium]